MTELPLHFITFNVFDSLAGAFIGLFVQTQLTCTAVETLESWWALPQSVLCSLISLCSNHDSDACLYFYFIFLITHLMMTTETKEGTLNEKVFNLKTWLGLTAQNRLSPSTVSNSKESEFGIKFWQKMNTNNN